MTDAHLEDRIRLALRTDAERAPTPILTLERFLAQADLSTSKSDRLTRQRVRRRSTSVRWTAAAAAVLLGAGIATIALTDRENGSAFASWVSRPESISATQAAAVAKACSDRPVGRGPLVVSGQQPKTLGRTVITDRRGHTAYAVFSNGHTWTDCITTIPGLSPDRGLPNSYTMFGTLDRVETSQAGELNPLVVLSAKVPEGNAVLGHPITWVSGRISAAVTRIEIQTAAGVVVPTIHGQVFAAWWPGNDGDTATVRAYNKAGRLLSTVDQLNCSVRALVDPRIRVTGRAPTGGCQEPASTSTR